MKKDEALELVKELGEVVVTKLAEYGIDLEGFGPFLNGFVGYHKLGLNGVSDLMDQAIKMVKHNALIQLALINDLPSFMRIPK